MENITKRIPQKPILRFVPSTIIDGKKIRAVGDRIYSTPLNGTFHQFLEQHAIDLIGDEWWIEQEQKNKEEQSCLFQWADEFYKAGIEKKIQNPSQKVIVIPNIGTRLCWMLFCYDLLCLKHRFSLPQELIERLKSNDSFQSARYELAIGAILVRAGFDLVWIKPSGEKSCELMATHKKTSCVIGVEVKSKRYPNVLNEKGKAIGVIKPLKRLLKKALKQGPEKVGFLIFIDLNLSPDIADEKLVDHVNLAIKNSVKDSSEDNPNPFSLIAFTNFPFHYGEGNVKYAFACPPHPKYPIPLEVQQDIEDSLYYYSYVPSEI